MDPDRVEGNVRNALGRGEMAVGQALDSPRLKSQGALDRVAGTAQDALGRVRGASRDVLGSSGDYAQRGAVAVRERVNNQPLIAIALAGAVGFVLAWAINRRW
ncbi:MAG TPA: hypothetical protein VND97_08090 [Beijerinckiaceae bacterium]|nr:hypothetical protein [Beijerinckiaceae bacterium]